jgi:hypothetical protein
MTIALYLHPTLQDQTCFVAHGMTSWLKNMIGFTTGLIFGEEGTNERRLAETVDDTQGIEVGETGRSAIMKFAFCLRLLLFVYSYKDTFYESNMILRISTMYATVLCIPHYSISFLGPVVVISRVAYGWQALGTSHSSKSK